MKEQKIVCHILNSILPSGAETMLKNSAGLWKGYEKYMIATAEDIGGYAEECEKAGYHIVWIYNKNVFRQHYMIRKFLKSISPDVVHIHRESQEYLYALDARATHVHSIVRTVHSVFEFYGILRVRRIITRAIGRWIGERYIAIGDSVYENERKRFFNTPTALINNWCDEDKIDYINEERYNVTRRQMGIERDTFVIVSVGNCNVVKNHILLLKALKQLKKLYKDANILYFHVGHGVDEEEERKFAEENQLNDWVQFEGRKEPWCYYHVADIYVMPSLYEGVGISAIEAMRAGVPCILTDVSGLKDFRNLNSEDIYYSNLTVADLTEQLKNTYQKFKEGNLKHSESLSQKVSEKYSRANSVKEYLEIYTR